MSPFVGALILIGIFISIIGDIIMQCNTSNKNLEKIKAGMSYDEICNILGMQATSISKMLGYYFIQWHRISSGNGFSICMKFDYDYKLLEITTITRV